jgi:hypothetical protein
MRGKEILQQSDWSPATFEQALEAEAGDLADPDHSRSALQIIGMLVDHCAELQIFGRFDEVKQFAVMLSRFLGRHPELKRLRDLDMAAQFGVRVDALFQALYAVEHISTPDKARAAVNTEVRRRILEYLVRQRRSVSNSELTAECKLGSRQHLHQTIPALREAGLVGRPPGAATHHYATPLGFRIMEAIQAEEHEKALQAAKREQPRAAARPPALFELICRHENLDLTIPNIAVPTSDASRSAQES